MNNNTYKRLSGMCLTLTKHLRRQGGTAHVKQPRCLLASGVRRRTQAGRQREGPDPRGASYLAGCGVFTQQRFVVGGKDGRVVVDVQHRHQRDALPDLDRILWKRKEKRPFTSQRPTEPLKPLKSTNWREAAGSGTTSWVRTDKC